MYYKNYPIESLQGPKFLLYKLFYSNFLTVH